MGPDLRKSETWLNEGQLPNLILPIFGSVRPRVSTKWLNLLRKICAISRKFFFLRTFALFLRMKRNEFCAVLRYFFAQFAQNRKFYAKCNFLGTLSKIDILSLELNN